VYQMVFRGPLGVHGVGLRGRRDDLILFSYNEKAYEMKYIRNKGMKSKMRRD
jgi:hypothetical protein